MDAQVLLLLTLTLAGARFLSQAYSSRRSGWRRRGTTGHEKAQHCNPLKFKGDKPEHLRSDSNCSSHGDRVCRGGASGQALLTYHGAILLHNSQGPKSLRASFHSPRSPNPAITSSQKAT